MAKTELISIEKTEQSKIDLETGTLSNVSFKGKALKGYSLKLALNPVVEGLTVSKIVGETATPSPLPSESISNPPTTETPIAPSASPETTISPIVEPSATPVAGTELVDWEIITDKPLKAGFYKVTAQSQFGDFLTPDSGIIMFEVTLANGGDVRILTLEDLNPSSSEKTLKVLGINISKHPLRWTAVITALIVLFAVSIAYISKKLIKKQLNHQKPNPEKSYIDQRKIN